MSEGLQRLTTEYVLAEDRILLSGEKADRQTVALWLTRPLLDRLLPPLTQWLEQQGRPVPAVASMQAVQQSVWQSFAQQAARAQQGQAARPRVTPNHFGWRVEAVDLMRGDRAVRLTFKGDGVEPVGLTLAPQPLRQWLNILYDQCRCGQWSLTAWPAWVEDAQDQSNSPRAAVLH